MSKKGQSFQFKGQTYTQISDEDRLGNNDDIGAQVITSGNNMVVFPNASLNRIFPKMMPEPRKTTKPTPAGINSLSDLRMHFPHLGEVVHFLPDATPRDKSFLYYAVIETTDMVNNQPVYCYSPDVILFHTEDELRQYLVEMLEVPQLTVLLTGRRGNWQLFDWSGVADGYDFACPGDWLMSAMFGDNVVFCKHDVQIKFDASGEHAEAMAEQLFWNGEMGYIPEPLNALPRPVQDELNKLAYYSVSGQRRLNFLEHRQTGQIKMTKQLVISAAELSGREISRTGTCTVTLQALLDAAVRGV